MNAYTQKLPYQIYNAKGKSIKYKKYVKQSAEADVVLFGELHNNAIAHWLELELLKDIAAQRAVKLGAEMFASEDQNLVNQYLDSTIDYKALDTLVKLWPNFKTDYLPLLDFAKDNQIEFIATNAPRRLSLQVYRQGLRSLDSLSIDDVNYLVPLPFPLDTTLSTYKSILEMDGFHGSMQIVKAQALKDATMAHFILEHFKPNELFLHFNGAFHTDFYEGILWYLKQQQADLNYITISTVEQADIKQLEEEHLGKADFIICVDEDVTKTY